MGGTFISNNIKRVSDRIDPQGNIINPKTKQIVQTIEPEFVPPTPQVIPPEIVANATTNQVLEEVRENKLSSKIEDIISKKIEEIINKKVAEVLEKL